MVATFTFPESLVFVPLRAWLIAMLGSGIEVVREMGNRVPSPKSGFILVSCIARKPLSVPAMSYIDKVADGDGPEEHAISYKSRIDYTIQLNFYGELAADWATTIGTLYSTITATEHFKSYGLSPLYSEDPKQISFISGEKQYEPRWVLMLHLQYNPSVSIGQEFAEAISVEIINVDRTYPA